MPSVLSHSGLTTDEMPFMRALPVPPASACAPSLMVSMRVPPARGNIPELMMSIPALPPIALTVAALTTYSPDDSQAGTLSSVGPPGPLMYPPVARRAILPMAGMPNGFVTSLIPPVALLMRSMPTFSGVRSALRSPLNASSIASGMFPNAPEMVSMRGSMFVGPDAADRLPDAHERITDPGDDPIDRLRDVAERITDGRDGRGQVAGRTPTGRRSTRS